MHCSQNMKIQQVYIHSFSFSFHLGKNDTQKPKINFGNLQDGGSIDDVPFEKLKENFF